MADEHDASPQLTRRALLRGAAVAGGLAATAGVAAAATTATTPGARTRRRPRRPTKPNILVIVVDQMRYPQWLAAGVAGAAFPPNIQRLRDGGVLFARHYAASNDCSPARSTMLTGLYTHQTWTLITGGSTLDPGFPTWGGMLREHGYHTRWLGKWHLTHGDRHWNHATGERALERYGFAGGIFPSPNGSPGQGYHRDPVIVDAFRRWLREDGAGGPWCTTLSFVNPHDIAWWYALSGRVKAEASSPRVAAGLPPNFQTPADLARQGKPRLQRSLQQTAAVSFGGVPFEGPDTAAYWRGMLDLYVALQRMVDEHVGAALDALEERPEIAANTVVVFTADHGEYAASHGLRGKGAGVYEEGIRVPLIVKDPRGLLTRRPELVRRRLTSSVDLAPLLLTIAAGSDAWRREAHYAHLAGRADLARMLADPAAPGRSFVLHATDEIVTEFALEPYAADAPLHVQMIRTERAKYATYSNWIAGTTIATNAGREEELYDYRHDDGRLETENSAARSALTEELGARLADAAERELRAPLPESLRPAQRRGLANYLDVAQRDALVAAEHRRALIDHALGDRALLRPPPVGVPR
ncbi:MAG TPA: sulfatase-like hydrolase/transferase [Solirubrobacteraceae bacterium]|nr:sulfatase-like hydrolase/transferase [Solirubrobacteraceae bacterium]